MRPPLNQQTVGPVRMVTEDALAVHLMFEVAPALGCGGQTRTPVRRVVFKHVEFEDVSLDTIRVVGLRPGDISVEASKPKLTKKTSVKDFTSLFDMAPDRRHPDPRPSGDASMAAEDDGVPVAHSSSRQLGSARDTVLEELGLAPADVGLADDDMCCLYAAHLGESREIEILRDLLAHEEKSDVDGDDEPLVAADVATTTVSSSAPRACGPSSSSSKPAVDVASSSSSAPPAAAVEAPAETIEAPANPWAAFNLRQGPGRTYLHVESGANHGRVHIIGLDGSAKATCARHKSCVCWLNKYVPFDKAERDLVAWLSLTGSKEEHKEAAVAVKLSHGMKVRSK